MRKLVSTLVISIAVAVTASGCAVTYTYEGKKYSSKEDFHRGVDSTLSTALTTIAPLSAPVTTKRLVFGIPSETAMYAENVRRFVAIQGTQPIGNAKEIIENLTKSNYKNSKVFFDAAQKKNIYTSIQFVDFDTMTGSIEPSSTSDAVYYVEASQGSGQWYYASAKHGKQVFAYDRSSPTPAGKMNGFVDGLQAQAIRD